MNAMNVTTVGLRVGTDQNNSAKGTPVLGNGYAEGLFGGVFHSAAQQVNRLEESAQHAVVGLMNGSGVEVHDAMIATQKSDLAFQLALQVRNKAVSAYQQMMQMQF